MSKVEEIEQLIKQLPAADLDHLSHWIELRRAKLDSFRPGQFRYAIIVPF
jgi:hypothetical protein